MDFVVSVAAEVPFTVSVFPGIDALYLHSEAPMASQCCMIEGQMIDRFLTVCCCLVIGAFSVLRPES